MGRKCSRCGKMGHNSRTCTTQLIVNNIMRAGVGRGGLRLFGVQLDLSSSPSSSSLCLMALGKNVKSCLSSSSSLTPSTSTSSRFNSFEYENSENMSKGYLSDGLTPLVQERKKGVPWSEEEHRVFLIGLEIMGKGNWRGISRHFVTTRTATQIASHAQKYFLRKNTFNKKKRRPCLVDVGRDKLSVQLINNPSISRPNYEAASSSIIPYGRACKAKTIPPVVNHGVVGDETRTQWPAVSHRSKALTLGFHETFDSSCDQPTTTTAASALDPSAAAAAPDLELKLAALMPLEQTKPCPRGLL